jgi:hypothetical protein
MRAWSSFAASVFVGFSQVVPAPQRFTPHLLINRLLEKKYVKKYFLEKSMSKRLFRKKYVKKAF